METKQLAAGIVASYVEQNKVAAQDLPALIQSVYAALKNAGEAPAEPVAEAPGKPTPKEVRKSITPNALISFIDGRPYKMLKRHVTAHGHTPASYRAAFGLSSDYPMTAPAYSEARSALAKSIGLGAKRKAPEPEPPAVAKSKAPAAGSSKVAKVTKGPRTGAEPAEKPKRRSRAELLKELDNPPAKALDPKAEEYT